MRADRASQRACGTHPRALGPGRKAQQFGMLVNEFRRCALLDAQASWGQIGRAKMGIRILFVAWAVIMLASQLICGCSTFLNWLSAG